MQVIRHENLKSSLSDNRPEAIAASFQTSEGEHQHALLFPNIEDSTFHHLRSKDRAVNIIEIKDFIIL